MDVRNYFYFLWRIKWALIGVALVFGVSCSVYTFAFSETYYEGIVFMTIGMEQGSYPEDAQAFGARGVEEADSYFTETVQGWTMDPAFVNDIYDYLGWVRDDDLSVSARKQERQNLILSIATSSINDVQQAASGALGVLEERMGSYNETMDTSYKIANPETTVLTHEPKVLMNGLTGFVVGGLLVVVFILVYEFLSGRVTFPFQAENILGKKSLYCMCSMGPASIVKHGSHILSVGFDFKNDEIEKKFHGSKIVKFSDFKKGDYLLFVKMGCAKEKDLEFIRRFADSFEWIEVL